MTVKDRLIELQSAQNDEGSSLLPNGNEGHLKIEIDSKITTYNVSNRVKEVKPKATKENNELNELHIKVIQTRDLIQKIEDETIALRKLQDNVLWKLNNEGNQAKIDESMNIIKSTSVNVKNDLRELENIRMTATEKNTANSRAVVRILTTQLSLLRKQYVNAMTEYQNALVAFKEKTERRLQEELQIVDRDMTNEELEAMLNKHDTAVFVGNYLKETMDAREKLQIARLQHQELLKIEMSIAELHDMFVDMAVLVESQGEAVDRIESYVTEGVGLVSNGNTQLMEAKVNQAKSRKKKIFIGVCLGSILLIIILVTLCEIYIWLKS